MIPKAQPPSRMLLAEKFAVGGQGLKKSLVMNKDLI